MYQKYKDQGLLIITLLTENYEQEPPDQDQLNEWADEYGQTFPVVSDADRYIHTFGKKGTVKLPSFTLLGPGAEVLVVNKDITEDDIIAVLP